MLVSGVCFHDVDTLLPHVSSFLLCPVQETSIQVQFSSLEHNITHILVSEVCFHDHVHTTEHLNHSFSLPCIRTRRCKHKLNQKMYPASLHWTKRCILPHYIGYVFHVACIGHVGSSIGTRYVCVLLIMVLVSFLQRFVSSIIGMYCIVYPAWLLSS